MAASSSAPPTAEEVARYTLRVTSPNVERALLDLHMAVTEARGRARHPMAYEARMILSAATDLLAAVVVVETLEGVLPAPTAPETHT